MKKLITAMCLVTAAMAPATVAVASETGPIVQLRECPEGYVGRTVFVGDRGLIWGCYRLLP